MPRYLAYEYFYMLLANFLDKGAYALGVYLGDYSDYDLTFQLYNWRSFPSLQIQNLSVIIRPGSTIDLSRS